MRFADRPVFSRRHLIRALLGRPLPRCGADAPPAATVSHAAGDAAYAAGDFPAAVTAYRTSVRQDLANTAVRTRLGYALYAIEQRIQAKVEFEHALRLTQGRDVLARLGLALTLLRLDKPGRAGELLAGFTDAGRPTLVSRAQAVGLTLTAGHGYDPQTVATELEALARETGLVPTPAGRA
jgi:hypothetical protein